MRACDALSSKSLTALRRLVALIGVEPARRATGLSRHTFDRARRGGRIRAIEEACEARRGS